MTKEAVDHPSHYKTARMEVIDIIEEFKLGFCLGNVIKYVLRAGRKNEQTHIEDLEKAHWYLGREIETLKKSAEVSKSASKNVSEF